MGTGSSKSKLTGSSKSKLDDDFPTNLENSESSYLSWSEDENSEIGAIGEKKLDGVLLVHAHGSLHQNESKMTLTERMTLTDPQMVVMTFCRVGESLMCWMPASEKREKTFISKQFESGNPLLLKSVTQFEVDERRCRYKYPKNSACVKSIRLRVGSEKGTEFTFPMIFGGSVVADHNEWEGLFYCDKNGCRDVTTVLGVTHSPSKYIYEPTSKGDFKFIQHEKSLELFNVFDVENEQTQDRLNEIIDRLFKHMYFGYIDKQSLITAELIDTIIQLFIPPEEVIQFESYLDSMISFDDDGLDSLAKQRITFLKSLNVFLNQTSSKVHLTLAVDKKFMFLACMLFRGDGVENLQHIYDDIVKMEKVRHSMLFSLKKSDDTAAAVEEDIENNKLYFMDKNNVGRVHVLFLSILRMIQNVNKEIECDDFAELSDRDKRKQIVSIVVSGSVLNCQWVMSKYEKTNFSTIIPILRSELMDSDPSKELLVSLPLCRGIPGCPPPSSPEHSRHGSQTNRNVVDIGGGEKKQKNKKTKKQKTKKQKIKKQKTKKQGKIV